MINFVRPDRPKVYIEEEGRKIEVDNVIGFYPELKLIEILPNSNESYFILQERVYLIKPFDVFISFEGKEISFLGSVDIKHYEYASYEDVWDYSEESSSSPGFVEENMYIKLLEPKGE